MFEENCGNISKDILDFVICFLLRTTDDVISFNTKTLTLWRPNRPKPARLSILLCLTPDNFTRQWGTPGSQWVNCSLKNYVPINPIDVQTGRNRPDLVFYFV